MEWLLLALVLALVAAFVAWPRRKPAEVAGEPHEAGPAHDDEPDE